MKVMVAGAGFAGLFAAWTLHRRGHEVTVFEARQRVGGRVWSEQLGNGAWIERGAEFIFPGEHTILGLCAELRLPVISHGLSFYRRRTPHGPETPLRHMAWVREKLAATLAEDCANDVTKSSIDDVFGRALGGGYRDDAVYLRKVTSLAADPSVASGPAELTAEAAGMAHYLDDCYHVAGGNQRVAKQMAQRLGSAVRLETPVEAIAQTRSQVEFVLAGGERASADVAIVAVPLPILKRLKPDFTLPSLMDEALSALIMGAAVKVSWPLAESAPISGVQSAERWWAWNSAGPSECHSTPAVTVFASTPPGAQPTAQPEATEAWRRRLDRLRPELSPAGAGLVTEWAHEAWTEGSYSAHACSWRREHDLAFNALAGRVAFAGEHTSAAAVRGMEGALRTGQRAALLLEAGFG
jgi:monoamine oxidase